MSQSQTPLTSAQRYYDERWSQLNGILIAQSEGAHSYLLTVNGGALAGMLAFVGAVAEVRHSSAAVAAIAFFAIGLVNAGFTRAYTLHFIGYLLSQWRDDYASFLRGSIPWNELLRRDDARVHKYERWGYFIGYGSFGAFLIGLIFGASALFNLPS